MNYHTYIYFIQEGLQGNIKIGMSDDPIVRMLSLQHSHARQLELLGVIEGEPSLEKKLHHQFKNNWVRYEWFEPAPCLIDFIDENTSLNGFQSQLKQLKEKREKVAKKIGTRRIHKEPKSKPKPIHIRGIREHIKREEWRWWYDSERIKPLEGIYRIKRPEIFSKQHCNFYYVIDHSHDFYGALWVCIDPIKKNGAPASTTDQARLGRQWHPFDALEWFTDHIDPLKPNPKKAHKKPKSKKNSLSIKDAKKALRLLSEGMTQAEVAKKFGVCQNYISSIKLGKIKRYRHLVDNPVMENQRTRAILSEPDVLGIIDRLVNGESQSKIAGGLEIAQTTVSHIYTGRTWKHLPRPWIT